MLTLSDCPLSIHLTPWSLPDDIQYSIPLGHLDKHFFTAFYTYLTHIFRLNDVGSDHCCQLSTQNPRGQEVQTSNIHSIISPKKPSSTLLLRISCGVAFTKSTHRNWDISMLSKASYRTRLSSNLQMVMVLSGIEMGQSVCCTITCSSGWNHGGNHVCRSAQHLPYANWSISSKENGAALILTASTHSQEWCAIHLSIVWALQKLSSEMRMKYPFSCCPRNRGCTIFVEL